MTLTVFITFLFGSIKVYGVNEKNITLLGDSITTGYGLAENEINYGDYLSGFYNANTDNFAKDGLTTDGLIDMLSTAEIVSSIEKADIICISIGGNDFFSVFTKAMKELGLTKPDENGGFSISAESISKFITDYTSAFGEASVIAQKNITVIESMVSRINPDAEIVMQTVYNPFEVSDEKTNAIMTPLKIFAGSYLDSVNDVIRETAPYTADINLKFSQKPYLFTNIEKYDIHPNADGHMLIAEEIIQTLSEKGDFTEFAEIIYSIPNGTFSKYPEFISDELNSFAEGNLRRESLSKAIERYETVSVDGSAESEANTTEAAEKNKDESESGKNNMLSKILMIVGFIIIILTTMLKFIRKKKNK